MCAIIGFASDNTVDAHRDLLVRVIEQSRIRGLHAFGVAFYDADNTLVVRRFLQPDHLANFIRTVDLPQRTRMIVHARYSTSGDWRVEDNNQPLVLGNTALAFNGVLHMGTKEQMEAELGVPMTTDNDGEMFLHRMAMGWEPATIVRQGSFSGVWLSGGSLHALSNGRRPAWLSSGDGFAVVVSTQDIAHRAGLPTQLTALPLNVVLQVEP